MTEKCVLEKHIEEHFKNLFNQVSILPENGLIEETIPYLVNDHTNTMLTNMPSSKEIHQTVMDLNCDDAHGPDGFGADFYKYYWEVIKLML